MRKAIPNSKEKKVLVMSKHCCCICQAERIYKPVAIHHIDGNNSNNKLENLAVLCLDHHSMADAGLKKGKVGSGKKLILHMSRSIKNSGKQKSASQVKSRSENFLCIKRSTYKFSISLR